MFIRTLDGQGNSVIAKDDLAADLVAGGPVADAVATATRTRVAVTDHGAALDGATNDLAAFNAARSEAGTNGSIVVPQGSFTLSGTPTAGSSAAVLWKLEGQTYPGSSAPVVGIGKDVVETFLPNNGGKVFSRTSSDGNTAGSILTARQEVNHTGGIVGALSTLSTETYVSGAPTQYVWGGINKFYDSSHNPPINNVAGYNQYNRLPGGTSWGWASCHEAHDHTGLPSDQTGVLIGIEVDIFANDDDPGDQRVCLDVVVGRHDEVTGPLVPGSHVEAGFGVRVCSVFDHKDSSWFKRGVAVTSGITVAAFDASQASYHNDPIAYRVGGGNRIDMSSDGSKYLTWNTGGALHYFTNGSLKFQIADDGSVFGFANIQAAGAVIAPYMIEATPAVPATSTSPGVTGQRAWDANYEYRCVATNTWKRSPLSSW